MAYADIHYEKRLFKYIENFTSKTENFQIKNFDLFLFFFLFLARKRSMALVRTASNEYPQSMFSSKNKKNTVYPCKPKYESEVKII